MKSRNSDPPELSLEDTLSQQMRGVPAKSRVKVAGYNPYDAVPQAKSKDTHKRPTDLRKLSEWIRLHRAIAELKKREA